MPVSIQFNADRKKEKGEPILAVIYARYSSHSQTEQSIEGQLAAAHQYAKTHGYTVVREYCDRAQTGRNDNRDAFQQMLSDTDKKQFDVIITWKVDRIGRNREDIAFNKHRCKKNGIRIEYVAENLPDSPEAVILESVLEGMAEYYSLQLSANVKRGLLESANKLQYIGGFHPYGYKRDPETKKLVIDPVTAPIVKEIFNRYIEGQTETQILNWLNNQGYTTVTKKPFSKTVLNRILQSEKYYGLYTYKDIVKVENGIPAIIDKATFDKVQLLISKNRRAPNSVWIYKDYILTEKLFCGKCGSAMVGESGNSHTGAKYGYYTCMGKRKKKICDKKSVRQDWIENLVLQATVDLLSDDGFIEWIANKTYQYYLNTNKAADEKTALQKELDTVNLSIDRILSAIEAGAYTDRMKTRLDELNAQKTDLAASIAEINLASRFQITQDHVLFFLKKFRDADLTDRECQKRLINTFVNSVFVYDDHIKIGYNYTSDNNTLTVDTINQAEAHGTVERFVCRTDRPAKRYTYEPEVIILNGTFVITTQTKTR